MRSLLISLMIIGTGAIAAESYRWVDKDGRVHFSDKPPEGQEPVERIALKEQQRLSVQSLDGETGTEKIEASVEAMRLDRQARAQERNRLAEEQQRQDRDCEEARTSLKWLSGHYVPYQRQEDGSKRVLDEREIKEQRTAVEAYLAKHC